MTPAQAISLIAAAVLILLFLALRRFIFGGTALGVFLLSHTCFVFTGVLMIPWILPLLGETFVFGRSRVSVDLFSHIPFWLFSQQELMRGILLTVGGACLVTCAYLISRALLRTPGRGTHRHGARPAASRELGGNGTSTCDPQIPGTNALGFEPRRLYMLSVVPLLITSLYLVLERQAIWEGVYGGFMHGDSLTIMEARDEIGENFVFIMTIFNLMPFFSVALCLYNASLPQRRRAWYPRIFFVITVVGLIVTFQKRPLIIFLLTLLWARRLHDPSRLGLADRGLLAVARRRLSDVLALGMLFAILIAFYALFTQVGRNGETAMETVVGLGIIAFSRAVLRLASPAILYSHYFPQVDEHYGLSNIGLFAKLLGYERYRDTVEIANYCSADAGSTAVGAMIDFYGGFGMSGWLVGCLLLGLFLERLDRFLEQARHRHTAMSVLITMYAFVFVYYLSQASLPRALNGYGGAWFLICSVALSAGSLSRRRALRPALAPA